MMTTTTHIQAVPTTATLFGGKMNWPKCQMEEEKLGNEKKLEIQMKLINLVNKTVIEKQIDKKSH